jgi:hypothetical protein
MTAPDHDPAQEYFELSDTTIRLVSAAMATSNESSDPKKTAMVVAVDAIDNDEEEVKTTTKETMKTVKSDNVATDGNNRPATVAPESPNPLPTGPCIVCGTPTFKTCWDCGFAFTCSRLCADRLLDAVERMYMPDDPAHKITRLRYGFAATRPKMEKGVLENGFGLERGLLMVYKAVWKGYEIGPAQIDQWREERMLGQRIGELLKWAPDKADIAVHLMLSNPVMKEGFEEI